MHTRTRCNQCTHVHPSSYYCVTESLGVLDRRPSHQSLLIALSLSLSLSFPGFDRKRRLTTARRFRLGYDLPHATCCCCISVYAITIIYSGVAAVQKIPSAGHCSYCTPSTVTDCTELLRTKCTAVHTGTNQRYSRSRREISTFCRTQYAHIHNTHTHTHTA